MLYIILLFVFVVVYLMIAYAETERKDERN